VPLFTRSIGVGSFIISGVAAVAVFALFLLFLRRIGRERLTKSLQSIQFWAGTVLLSLNLFYFFNILPPLPLALSSAGMYHHVATVGNTFYAKSEPQPWYASFGVTPIYHVRSGEPLYAFSAVFAPIALSTTIIHRWEYYDEAASAWQTTSRVSFPISGGRERGYRVYSVKQKPFPGVWRVTIETADGRLVGRISFKVERVTEAPLTESVTL